MHNIHHAIYPENVDKKSVQKYWDHYAAMEDWQEGCFSLSSNIRWLDIVCDSLKDAEDYIESHDRGSYDQLAVKFIDFDATKTTSSIKDRLLKQIDSYREKKKDFNAAHSISKLKAEYISCPNCKSRLCRAYLIKRSNYHICPVCNHKDIRADYIPKQLQSYQEKIDAWQKQLASEEKKLAKKIASRAKIKWLVKIEYHT